MKRFPTTCLAVAALFAAAQGFADQHTAGVPTLNSRPGAAYTVYLDFSGFDFTGAWGSSGKTPGNLPSYNGAASTDSFSASNQATISNVWAGIANAYSPFSVNVTTVDPAVAAGQADTDVHRQAYYDATARVLHTVVTTSYTWYGTAGGVSWVDVASDSYSTTGNSGAGLGWHTNYVFTNGVGTGQACWEAGAHENGHAFGLNHQSDWSSTNSNEYSYGTRSSSGSANPLNGSYAPVMGAAYYTQRGEWRLGTKSSSSSLQNDAKVLAGLSGMGGFIEDGVGHTLNAATTLPLTGATVDVARASGVIVPLSSSNPQPIGVGNYTADYWKFTLDADRSINLTVMDGDDLLTPGTRDSGAMLRSKLNIYDDDGNLVGAGLEAQDTLSETFSGLLAAGDYTAQVTSFGGLTQALPNPNGGDFATTYYYDMGGYFITGTGFANVPEPATCALVLLGGIGLLRARRKRAA